MDKSILISEIIAEMFYEDTGIMAPYKSVPDVMAYGIYQDREAWSKKFDEWSAENKNRIKIIFERLEVI
jgi:hypothetical protein